MSVQCSWVLSALKGNFPFCSKLPAPRSLKTFPRIAGYRIFKTLFLRKSNLMSLPETIRIHVLGKSNREVRVWGRRAFFQTGLGQLVRPKYVSSFYSYPKNYPPRIHRVCFIVMYIIQLSNFQLCIVNDPFPCTLKVLKSCETPRFCGRRESVSWLSFSRTMWICNFAWLRHCT